MRIRALFLFTVLLLYSGIQAKTGLALSGGGARSFAHIGVLKVLDQENIKIDCISGTSTGAVIASLYACGYSADQIEKIFLDIDWEGQFDDSVKRNDQQINFKLWQDASNFSFKIENFSPMLPEGMVPGNRMINKLFNLFWNCSIYTSYDSLSIPLRITASDMLSGQPKVFSEGNLHESVFASFCFPTLIQPYKLDNSIYIDGGILMNLPVEPLLDLQADFVIGVGANSALLTEDELQSIVDVLSQTAGLAMNTNISNSKNKCDLFLEPELLDYELLDFDRISEIIELGEKAAQKALPLMENLPRRKTSHLPKICIADRILLTKIDIMGNNYLKEDEIKSYLDLEAGKTYTQRQMRRSFERAYNSQLYDLIYPVLTREKSGYKLTVKVQEKHNFYLKFNLAYNTEDKLNLRLILDHKNLLLENSRLLSCLELAQNNQFCLDYTKNFGEDSGFYFHLFPYLQEIPLYAYNSQNQKTEKVQAFESGFTSGLGVFFKRSLALELYSFAYEKKLYRDIGSEELDNDTFSSWGAGAKLYFETLDNPTFPMNGIRFLSKINLARSENREAGNYKKSIQSLSIVQPLTTWSSLHYRFQYGSYFNKEIPYDPFYIGGMDSFMGLKRYDRSSSVYKINSFALRFNPAQHFYLEAVVNNLNLGEIDQWTITEDTFWGYGFTAGYHFALIPLKIGVALDENTEVTGYLNLGYCLDMFEFSRR